MPVAYPLALRTIILSGKSRSQPAAFTVAQPRRGWGYVEPTGTDVPVFWTAQFKFTTEEAATFRLWFVNDLERGVQEFTLPIRTEFGTLTYTCQFLPDSLMTLRENGAVWEYSATIMARAEILPGSADSFDENAVFNDEGDATTGWSASNGAMSSASSYIRLTKSVGSGSVALATKSSDFVSDSKDWILYGKMRASRGTNHCGAIWLLNNGDPISPDANAAIWFGSTGATTGTYSDTALSIICTTGGGAVRNVASLGTGYAYDTVPVEFALHYDNKWSVLNCFIKQASGKWLWKARVAGEFFSPPNIQMAIASTAPISTWVDTDFLTLCRPNLMSIGDSICEGKTLFAPDPALALTDPTSTWQYHCLAYQTKRNNLIVNKGVGSQTSTQIASRLAADVTSHGPRVVFLHASTNDTVGGISQTTRTANVQSCIDTIAAAGGSTVLLNAMYGTSANALNPGLRDYMLEWWDTWRAGLTGAITAIDIMAPILSAGYMDAAKTQADDIHPTVTGYTDIGTAIAAAL